MYKEKSVSVVIPAYNEEKLIAKAISNVPEFVEKIIVVNKRKPIEQKLKILASCFNKIDLEGVYIVPALRILIEESNTLDL